MTPVRLARFQRLLDIVGGIRGDQGEAYLPGNGDSGVKSPHPLRPIEPEV